MRPIESYDYVTPIVAKSEGHIWEDPQPYATLQLRDLHARVATSCKISACQRMGILLYMSLKDGLFQKHFEPIWERSFLVKTALEDCSSL